MKSLMRIVVVFALLAQLACSQQPPLEIPQHRPALAMKGASVAHFDKPVTFWHFGKPFETQDAILLRIEVRDLFEFHPRDIGPPLFVAGENVAITIKDPLGDGQALVLVPIPAQGESPALWLTPSGFTPEELDQQKTLRLKTMQGADRPEALRISAPNIPAQPATYRDLNDLRTQSNRPKTEKKK